MRTSHTAGRGENSLCADTLVFRDGSFLRLGVPCYQMFQPLLPDELSHLLIRTVYNCRSSGEGINISGLQKGSRGAIAN